MALGALGTEYLLSLLKDRHPGWVHSDDTSPSTSRGSAQGSILGGSEVRFVAWGWNDLWIWQRT